LPSPRASESIGHLPASKFDEKLVLATKSPKFEDETGIRHGPCAMGGVAPGDSLTSIHVLLVQDADGRVATATGTSERLIRADNPPQPERWVVNTELEHGSDQFAVGKPAMAMAMAVVNHKDGGTEIDRWSQAVSIVRAE
jgi:hypothetical protein